MNTIEWTKDWGYPHYVALLFLYMAYADTELGEEEWALVLQKSRKAGLNDDDLAEVLRIYRKMNDIQIIEAFERFRARYLPDPESRRKLMKDVEELSMIDDKVTATELEVELFLNRMFR